MFVYSGGVESVFSICMCCRCIQMTWKLFIFLRLVEENVMQRSLLKATLLSSVQISNFITSLSLIADKQAPISLALFSMLFFPLQIQI